MNVEVDPLRAGLRADIRKHEQREQQLLTWKQEIDARLAKLLETPQPPYGSAERAIWDREREELEETLRELHTGPGAWSTGYMQAMAERDDAPILPGLNVTRQWIAELRAALEALGAD